MLHVLRANTPTGAEQLRSVIWGLTICHHLAFIATQWEYTYDAYFEFPYIYIYTHIHRIAPTIAQGDVGVRYYFEIECKLREN